MRYICINLYISKYIYIHTHNIYIDIYTHNGSHKYIYIYTHKEVTWHVTSSLKEED